MVSIGKNIFITYRNTCSLRLEIFFSEIVCWTSIHLCIYDTSTRCTRKKVVETALMWELSSISNNCYKLWSNLLRKSFRKVWRTQVTILELERTSRFSHLLWNSVNASQCGKWSCQNNSSKLWPAGEFLNASYIWPELEALEVILYSIALLSQPYKLLPQLHKLNMCKHIH